jgi:hypothetical protein
MQDRPPNGDKIEIVVAEGAHSGNAVVAKPGPGGIASPRETPRAVLCDDDSTVDDPKWRRGTSFR